MTIRPELLDELLKDYSKPEDLTGEGGILQQLSKALIERCLETEMTHHLADPIYQSEGKAKTNQGKAKTNRRNGHSKKTIKGEFGQATLEIPRDLLANIFRRETLLQIWLPMENLSRRSSKRGRPGLMGLIARFFPFTVVE